MCSHIQAKLAGLKHMREGAIRQKQQMKHGGFVNKPLTEGAKIHLKRKLKEKTSTRKKTLNTRKKR